jgi:hypothetical protein
MDDDDYIGRPYLAIPTPDMLSRSQSMPHMTPASPRGASSVLASPAGPASTLGPRPTPGSAPFPRSRADSSGSSSGSSVYPDVEQDNEDVSCDAVGYILFLEYTLKCCAVLSHPILSLIYPRIESLWTLHREPETGVRCG